MKRALSGKGKIKGRAFVQGSFGPEIMLELDSKNPGWLPAENGKSRVNLNLAAMSLTGNRGVLASKIETVTQSAPTLRIQLN